jgi:hypothetical protein
MFGLAWMLGPVLGTSIYQVSPSALWVACGCVGVVSAWLALAARRHPAPTPVDVPST